MKKFIATLMISVMVLGVLAAFAGCGEKRSYTIDLEVDTTVSRPVLKGLYPSSGMSDFADSYTSRQLEKMTGYKVEYSEISGSNEESEVSNATYNRNTYSFIKCGKGSFDQLVIQDAFADLTAALEVYGKDLLATIDKELWDACTFDGKIYGIPEYGFGYMQDTALIFNMKHLEKAGVNKIPETLTEFTETLHKLQDTFGSDTNYHAMAMTAAEAELSIISSAFEMPSQFYEDTDGTIKNYIYSDKAVNYYKYMNEQVYKYKSGCLPKNWDQAQAGEIMKWFANENISVAHLPYWYYNNLCEQVLGNNKEGYETIGEVKENLKWQTRIKGDGAFGSIKQEKGKNREIGDIGYVITIPRQSSADAPYALDWMNQRIQDDNYKAFLLGEEGVTYQIVTAEQATEEDVAIPEEDGSTTYYRLLDGYKQVIGNSMYTTGGNPEMGRKYWPLREKKYDCWDILLPAEEDDLMILSALAKAPVLTNFSKTSMESRSKILTYAQQMINAKGTSERNSFDAYLATAKKTFEDKYWTPQIRTEVQTWYDENRRGA